MAKVSNTVLLTIKEIRNNPGISTTNMPHVFTLDCEK